MNVYDSNYHPDATAEMLEWAQKHVTSFVCMFNDELGQLENEYRTHLTNEAWLRFNQLMFDRLNNRDRPHHAFKHRSKCF